MGEREDVVRVGQSQRAHLLVVAPASVTRSTTSAEPASALVMTVVR